MSAQVARLQRHTARLLRQWPQDNLRPICVHDSLKRRLAAQLKPSPDAATPNTAAADAKAQEEQLNALYSLVENRYSRQYPVSDKLLKPASKPSYYEDLAAELQNAPQRSWFQKQMMRWSRLVRMS